ncbi:hypothetical protein A6V39_01550 [Candidatus Mycoplasma haematobovis]|uniref:Uncharacterized protein n=1 Tax=Candidatus Mycoplasma haematobovis TaxID=432608 RepID=A0A1A9QFE7_9MOLU|nr:hypothetical protein [Candidatus Mycoplasma haematobovis]OAL10731.1 hypothetical protein A6V39_01550 [Candidatus Mycoplasma haematobovis]
MSYIKGYSFLKRTFVLLSPLFLVTLASKELAFYAPVATLSPILSDPKEEKDSIINLVSSLNKELPEGVEDYGSLKIQKSIWGEELWVEEANPLSTFSHNSDYKFQDAKEIIKSENSSKYVLEKKDFETIKEKGNINVLTIFDLVTKGQETIPITHVIPLADLTTVSTKTYTVITTKIDSHQREHRLTVTKDSSKQAITFELSDESKFIPSSSYLNQDLSSLVIKSFYILFNDSPPLNPKSYFTLVEETTSVVGDDGNSRVKKVFLNKWNNSSNEKSNSAEEPKYEFKRENDFWKSICSDPYKVGGFIDKDLKSETSKQQQQELKNQQIDGKETSQLKKQLKSWVEFKAQKKEAQNRNGQYFWKDIKQANVYVPHDESTETYDKCNGLDEETKTKFKEHLSSHLEREPKSYIDKKLAPEALIKEVKDGDSAVNGNSKYPYHKIVQSSFRAWGNAYLTKTGENLKEEGIYSKQFELANQSQHTFSIKLPKDIWIKNLIEGKLDQTEGTKKLNTSPDISSLVEVYYPLSFSFFDPVSSYLKKHSLLLKTELDLSNLYLTSSYSKEVFRFDIGNANREIGKDYQGFEPTLNPDKAKPYGLDGTLSFISKLELDQNKDLNIHLTAKVSGFVNTKNPSCDLRHRIYKIKSLSGDWSSLEQDWKCSSEAGWKYRKHIHIPSYLVISLTEEPEVSAFYIDKQSGIVEIPAQLKQETPKPIKTLSELSAQLEQKEIVSVVETDDTNKAEVYFRDIAAYGELKEGFPLDLNGWITSGQQVYYWYPRRATGTITNVNFENLKSIKLYLDGSKNSYNSFFHSNHFNTLTTLCVTSKYNLTGTGTGTGDKECADGNKYDKEEKDKAPSELHDLWGSQEITIEQSGKELSSKNDESQAYEVKFRVTYNRADRRDLSKKQEDNDRYEKIKNRLEKLFKDSDTRDPSATEIPDVSMLAFWYSVFFWKDKNKNDLHYATQIRPIGLITKEIKNANAHETIGAAGSAGFEISKFEFRYSSPKAK